jgi:predicted Zn-dependent protease
MPASPLSLGLVAADRRVAGLAAAPRRVRPLPALLVFFLCRTALPGAEPVISIPSYNQFSEQDERKIGEALAGEFEGKYPVLDNSLLSSYVASVTQRLAQHSRRPDLAYTCKVLNIIGVNAFSLPGGHIYVTRGLLDFTQAENELAAVIAHEIGHIAGRHALNRFSLELRSKEMWDPVSRALTNLAGAKLEQAFQAMGTPLIDMLSLRYDRANESEADLLAFYDLIRSGWNPAGQIRYLERIQPSGGEPDPFADWRLAHPDTGERSRLVSAELKAVALSPSLDDNSMAFRTMKLGLDLLPKPSSVK